LRLRAKEFLFEFPRPALVMGILNVTPDSFSDGGRFIDVEKAIEHGLRLVRDGAEVIDVGGESTRPQSAPVEEGEELRRVMPVVKGLVGKIAVPISIDTMKPGVARAAVEAGASLINDVAANRAEDSMWRLAAETGAAYVCVHMQGTPQTMQLNPCYGDVVREVTDFFEERMRRIVDCGVLREQIALDPGIGFGKTLEHNLELLGGLSRFGVLERPVCLGVSRKSFMGKLLGVDVNARVAPALACTALAIASGVQIVRTHDVVETVQAMRMSEAILAKQRS
jgi:dihydropteroate synthase